MLMAVMMVLTACGKDSGDPGKDASGGTTGAFFLIPGSFYSRRGGILREKRTN